MIRAVAYLGVGSWLDRLLGLRAGVGRLLTFWRSSRIEIGTA